MQQKRSLPIVDSLVISLSSEDHLQRKLCYLEYELIISY